MTLRFVLLLLVGLALIAGCGDSETAKPTPDAPTAGATGVATAVGDADAPMPQHVVFAPGETIAADGQAGIFFLDPKTRAAEGWVVPAASLPGQGPLPFRFALGGFSEDGGELVYSCQRPNDGGGLNVPCGGGADFKWYLLDTTSGARTSLDAFIGRSLSISPDGKTLFGETRDGLALADIARPAVVRNVALPAGTDLSYGYANWSPDGARIVFQTGFTPRLFLVNAQTATASALDVSVRVAWSPDGTRMVSWKQMTNDESGGVKTELHVELRVLDQDGAMVWSKRVASAGPGGTWSADGSLIYIETQDQPRAGDGYGELGRVEILDSSTGATAYRVKGGFCPIGWVGKTHRLLTSSYGFGEALVDLDGNSVRLFDQYVTPMPFDGNTAIVFNGDDFSSYDLATGDTKLIAHTTVAPAWDTNHGALFAGERLAFTALHGGHGGCGEGASPKDPPRPELLAGPFADDAPLTYGSPVTALPTLPSSVASIGACPLDDTIICKLAIEFQNGLNAGDIEPIVTRTEARSQLCRNTIWALADDVGCSDPPVEGEQSYPLIALLLSNSDCCARTPVKFGQELGRWLAESSAASRWRVYAIHADVALSDGGLAITIANGTDPTAPFIEIAVTTEAEPRVRGVIIGTRSTGPQIFPPERLMLWP